MFEEELIVDEKIGEIVSLINEIMNTVKDENIEAKDEYLNIKNTTIQVAINKKLNWWDKANKIPRYVATPLPPLNFNHIGKIWPKKTTIQDK